MAKKKSVAKPQAKKKVTKVEIVKAVVEQKAKITQVGKIRAVLFGQGGKDNHCFGFNFFIGSDKDGWGIQDFWGTYYTSRPEKAQWSEDDRLKLMGEQCMRVNSLLMAAKKTHVMELVNCPVEVTFDGDTVMSWRLLEEVM